MLMPTDHSSGVAAAVCCAMLALPSAASALQACVPTSVVTPLAVTLAQAPPNPAGCERGVHVRLADGSGVWRCPSGEGPGGVLLLVGSDGAMGALPDFSQTVDLSAMTLTSIDLDADGTDERILALWQSQSSAMGVNLWTVRVFDAGWNVVDTLVDVADWGPGSLVVPPDGRAGCDIALTTFESTGTGMVFKASFLQHSVGSLVPAAGRASLQRRVTGDFERQRTATLATDPRSGDAALWLSTGTTP
jgi:hypothetical protein